MLLLVFFLHLFLFACTKEWVRTDHDAVMVYISGHHMLSISAMYSRTISKHDHQILQIWFWTNAYTLDSIRTWTSCILLSLIWLTFVCVMLVFFRYFSKGHSPLNLKHNHHRKVTITHTCTVRFVYAVRNMQALLLMTFDNSYLLLLPWKLNKQTVTTTLFINLSTADNVLLIKPWKN